jgi:hypothetical protein
MTAAPLVEQLKFKLQQRDEQIARMEHELAQFKAICERLQQPKPDEQPKDK